MRKRKLAQDNVRKLDIKQNAFYDKRARSRKIDVGDKVLLLLPSVCRMGESGLEIRLAQAQFSVITEDGEQGFSKTGPIF